MQADAFVHSDLYNIQVHLVTTASCDYTLIKVTLRSSKVYILKSGIIYNKKLNIFVYCNISSIPRIITCKKYKKVCINSSNRFIEVIPTNLF